MVNESPSNIVRSDLLQVQRRQVLVSNTDVLNRTIYEDDYEEQRQKSASVFRLRENTQIKTAEEAVTETHRRVSVLHKVVNSGSLATSIDEQIQQANQSISRCYRDWDKKVGWIDRVIVALCNARYPEIAVDVIKKLIARDLVTDEATEQFARNIYGSLMNFSDRSDQFKEELAEAGLIGVLVNYLKDSEKIKTNALQDSKQEDFLRYSLAVLHNLAKDPELKHLFLSENATSVLSDYLNYKNEYVQCVSLLSVVQVLGDTPETYEWASAKDLVGTLTYYCNSALMSADHRCRGMHAAELAEGLCLLAVNKQFKEKLVQHSQITAVLKSLLTSLDERWLEEQSCGVELAWQLSFTGPGKTKIKHECLKWLKAIAASPNKTEGAVLKRNAAKTVAYIENWDKLNPNVPANEDGANNAEQVEGNVNNNDSQASEVDHQRLSTIVAKRNNGHVFLSYCHRQKESVRRVYDRLNKAGGVGNIWIDFKNIGSDWINDMAKGIENASVVVIFYSEAYKRSSNCKAEAEYAFSLQRHIIPVKAQPGYNPDGWLGMIVSSKTWIDMSSTLINDDAIIKLISEIKSARNGRPSSTNSQFAVKPLRARQCCLIS